MFTIQREDWDFYSKADIDAQCFFATPEKPPVTIPLLVVRAILRCPKCNQILGIEVNSFAEAYVLHPPCGFNEDIRLEINEKDFKRVKKISGIAIQGQSEYIKKHDSATVIFSSGKWAMVPAP